MRRPGQGPFNCAVGAGFETTATRATTVFKTGRICTARYGLTCANVPSLGAAYARLARGWPWTKTRTTDHAGVLPDLCC
jgi:hypothetical protein